MQNVHVKETQRHCHTEKQLTCVFTIPRMEVCTLAWHIARCCMYHLASHLFLVLQVKLPVLGRDHREFELQTMVLLATATPQTQRHSFPRQSCPLSGHLKYLTLGRHRLSHVSMPPASSKPSLRKPFLFHRLLSTSFAKCHLKRTDRMSYS